MMNRADERGMEIEKNLILLKVRNFFTFLKKLRKMKKWKRYTMVLRFGNIGNIFEKSSKKM